MGKVAIYAGRVSALLILVASAPLLLVLALLIRVTTRESAFFGQQRVGLGGRVFQIYKLRSMRELKAQDGELLEDALRITKVGRVIRQLSLDELPTLLNVIKGDMALVGPRPLLVEYLPLYNDFQNRRHEVLPGVTGWAQINGRNAIGWDEKFVLDVWYVDHQSFWLDIKILFLTVKKVLAREGVSARGEATMSKFTGASKE